jgi:PAS domain-containing protein
LSHEPSPETTTLPGPLSSVPVPGPAFALLSADGYVIAGTEIFTHLVGISALSAPAVPAAVAEIGSGRPGPFTFIMELPEVGSLAAEVEAVRDAHQQLILLQVSLPRPGAGPPELARWLARFSDDARAIVWLKDLDGHYLQINRQYTDQLGVDPDRIRGRTDAELSQFEAIDGPRNKRMGGPEPVQLEYVIPAFDRRPAYTALRFPVTDAAGTAVAVCGVASPADQADLARAECDRLLSGLTWLHGDPVALRRQVLGDWGLTAVTAPPPRAAPMPSVTAAAPGGPEAAAAAPGGPTAAPAPVPAEFTQLLVALQRQVSDLETKVGNPPAPMTETFPAAGEVADLRAQLTAARERTLEAESARQLLEARLRRTTEQLVASQARLSELQAAQAASSTQLAATGSDSATVLRLGWDDGARTGLAAGLRGALNVRSIFSEAVRLIGSAGGWDMVVAWLLHDEDGRFGCAATWVRSPEAMAALESTLWQLPQSPSASAVGTAAQDGALVWIGDLTRSADHHLAELGGGGLATVVLLPVRRSGQTVAVLELASAAEVAPSPAAEAALASIETEVAAAHQRVTDTATASQWGRRSR